MRAGWALATSVENVRLGAGAHICGYNRPVPAADPGTYNSELQPCRCPVPNWRCHLHLSRCRFASCGGDRQVFLWDVSTGNIIRKFRGHDAYINTVRACICVAAWGLQGCLGSSVAACLR